MHFLFTKINKSYIKIVIIFFFCPHHVASRIDPPVGGRTWASLAGDDEAPVPSPERLWPHEEEKERGRRGRAGTLATPGARPGAENGRGGRRAGKSWRGDKTRVLTKETAVSCVASQMLAAPLGAPGLRRSRPVRGVMDEQEADPSGSLI